MLIRTMHALQAEGRTISIAHDSASAVRMLTKSDGLGFSFSEAWGSAGISSEIWYKHHWEANYVCSGNGRLEDLSTGERWVLEPRAFYCVGPKDRHRLTIGDATDLRIASVFNPPLEGRETHDEDGAYPPTGDIPPGRERMFVKTREDVRNAGLEIISSDGAVTDARFLIADDRLGFGFSDVRLQAGLAQSTDGISITGTPTWCSRVRLKSRTMPPTPYICSSPEHSIVSARRIDIASPRSLMFTCSVCSTRP